MLGIPEAGAAINSIKTAFGVLKGISALKTETEINAAVIDIQRILLQAQEEAFADKEKIAELAALVRDLKAQAERGQKWEAIKGRYELTKSPLGAYTYDLKPEFVGEEAFHRLCPTCFNQGHKSLLHVKTKASGGEIVTCGRCQIDLTLSAFENTIMTFSTEDRGYDRWNL